MAFLVVPFDLPLELVLHVRSVRASLRRKTGRSAVHPLSWSPSPVFPSFPCWKSPAAWRRPFVRGQASAGFRRIMPVEPKKTERSPPRRRCAKLRRPLELSVFSASAALASRVCRAAPGQTGHADGVSRRGESYAPPGRMPRPRRRAPSVAVRLPSARASQRTRSTATDLLTAEPLTADLLTATLQDERARVLPRRSGTPPNPERTRQP